MKLLTTLGLCTAVALVAIGPAEVISQTLPPDSNEFGIYTDPTGNPASANVTLGPNETVGAYLVLTNPINPHFQADPADEPSVRPVTSVWAWEARILMPAAPTFFVLSEVHPPGFIDVGIKPDYVVGWPAPLEVTGGAVVLCTWQFLIIDGGDYEIFLGVTTVPGNPGTMGYVDPDDASGPGVSNIVSAYPSSGSYDSPVFSINAMSVVNVENESWGGLKALFR